MIFSPKSLAARNWVIRNLRRIQFAIQEEQVYAERGARLKNFHSSNLLCIWPSLFGTYLNKAKYSIYEKHLKVLKGRRFPFWGEIKPPTPELLTVHFSAALKVLALGNLFKLFRLDITFAREVCCLDKDEENMTIVLFFSLSPVANCPCECDGKSYKLG